MILKHICFDLIIINSQIGWIQCRFLLVSHRHFLRDNPCLTPTPMLLHRNACASHRILVELEVLEVNVSQIVEIGVWPDIFFQALIAHNHHNVASERNATAEISHDIVRVVRQLSRIYCVIIARSATNAGGSAGILPEDTAAFDVVRRIANTANRRDDRRIEQSAHVVGPSAERIHIVVFYAELYPRMRQIRPQRQRSHEEGATAGRAVIVRHTQLHIPTGCNQILKYLETAHSAANIWSVEYRVTVLIFMRPIPVCIDRLLRTARIPWINIHNVIPGLVRSLKQKVVKCG